MPDYPGFAIWIIAITLLLAYLTGWGVLAK